MIHPLSVLDLSLSALLVLIIAFLSWRMQLRLERSLLIAGIRTIVQLLLIGMVLKALFSHVHILWVSGLALFMVSMAGYEVWSRQQRRFSTVWGYGIGVGALFLSSVSIVIFALWVLIQVEPWYSPQYSIPLLGMLLGNTMNGVALGLNQLTQSAYQQRREIEAQLMLGRTSQQAMRQVRREAIRTGMIPIVNAMAAAGVVSLPGMMTGQILAGVSPVEAVKYQILIMFLIAAGTGFGTMAAVSWGTRRLFDRRHRLRLDRLAVSSD